MEHEEQAKEEMERVRKSQENSGPRTEKEETEEHRKGAVWGKE